MMVQYKDINLFMFYIIILILIIIAYQLWKVNQLSRLRLLREEDEDILKPKFPNIFFDYKVPILKWWSLQREMDADILYLKPWMVIVNDLTEKARHLEKNIADEILRKIEESSRLSMDFLGHNGTLNPHNWTKLTYEETAFLVYRFWSEQIVGDTNMEINSSGREIAIKIDDYRREFEHFSEKYKKYPISTWNPTKTG